MRSTRFSLLALATLFCACDPQAEAGYLGEPLMTLQGHVTSSGPMPALEAAMLWQRGEPPPPGAARRSLLPGEVTYARANAGAVPYGIAAGAVGALPASANGAYGIDANHWVVYVASDVPARSLTAWWLGAPLPAGFHLLRVAAVNPQCITPAQLDACVVDLTQRGVPDDGTDRPGTARFFCRATYRLSPALPGEQLVLDLGTVGLGPAGGSCP